MRVLGEAELEMVSVAAHAEHVGNGQPESFTTGRTDPGKHYGWCIGHGNTGHSSGREGAKGLDTMKHGIDGANCHHELL